jgi:predicted nucleic acid-binding protein
VTVVLDSWVILRYLEAAEPAAGAVAELLAEQRPVVSWMNLGEVFYVVRRVHGDDEAGTTVRDLREVIAPELPSERRVIEAASLKADHPMAYADAFAAATAIAHQANLWTGDPELLVDGSIWQWRDLRS